MGRKETTTEQAREQRELQRRAFLGSYPDPVRGVQRRTLIGLNAPGACAPGEIVQISTVNTANMPLKYTALLVPVIFCVQLPFDVIRFAIDGKEQIQGPIACSLLHELELLGDPVTPNATILLEVCNRTNQPNVQFQAALLVQYFDRIVEPAETIPRIPPPPPNGESMDDIPAEQLERVPGSTA